MKKIVRGLGTIVMTGVLAAGIGGCGNGDSAEGTGYQPVPPPDASWPSNAADAYVNIFGNIDTGALKASFGSIEGEDFDAVATILKDYREQIAQLMTASQIETCDWSPHDRGSTEGPVVYSEHVNLCSVLLVADAQTKLREGAYEAAADRYAANVRYLIHAAESDEMLPKLFADKLLSQCNRSLRDSVPDYPEWTKAASTMVLAELRKLDPNDPIGFADVRGGGSDMDSMRQYAADQLREAIDTLEQAG